MTIRNLLHRWNARKAFRHEMLCRQLYQSGQAAALGDYLARGMSRDEMEEVWELDIEAPGRPATDADWADGYRSVLDALSRHPEATANLASFRNLLYNSAGFKPRSTW